MRSSPTVESLKIDLIDTLNRLFRDCKIENLGDMIFGIDNILIENLKECMLQNACELFGADEPDHNTRIIKYSGITIEIVHAVNVPKDQTLVIGLLVRTLDDDIPRKSRTLTVRLNGIGRYDQIRFEIPSFIENCDRDHLKLLGTELFSVGYNWMNERITAVIRAASEETNKSLYEYVRIMVQDKRALEGFLFSAAVKDQDFVILDDFAARSALVLAQKNAERLGRSAADLAVQMIVEIVPIKDSVIRDVANSNHEVDIDLGRDDYYTSDGTFSESLRAVWGNMITCYPIVTDGNFLMVCFFMTRFKDYMVPILDAHRDRLREIALENNRSILRNLNVLSAFKKLSGAAKAGEFVGGLIAGYLKAHH
jgi:hypothetical protein